MASFTFYNNFTSGEVGPRIYPRIDLVQRKNGAKLLRNALPTVHGGWIGRPGTRFICRTKYADKPTVLVPFKFSINQSYVIELGHLYMRFITQGGRLEEAAQVVTGTSDNGSGLIQIALVGHVYSNGDFVSLRSIVGTVEANADWELSGVTANTFDLIGSTYTNAYISGGTANKIIEIASPYTETEVEDVDFTPDSDLLYLVHSDVTPKVLTRTSAITFTISDLTLIGGPFNDLNLDETLTMNPSATTGAITIVPSSAYFTADMVGQLIRIGLTTGSPAVQGYAEITGFTSDVLVNATVIQTLSSAAATPTWALGAFGVETGFPRSVSWFDQRLLFGGTDTQPQTCWASATTRVLDFSVGITASDAITFTIRTDEVNDIKWIASSSDMIVGTTAGEHKVTGGNNEALAPTNIISRQQTAYGSSSVRPVKIGDIVLHVQRGGQRIRQVTFSFDKDRYISNDLSLLAYHMFENDTVVDMSFQLQPDPIVWFTMASGEMRSCTLLPDQNVAAFARHTFANGLVERVLSQARAASSNDETYITVKRVINGATVRYIELFDSDLYTDSSLSGSFGSPVTTVSGLGHLEGETVRINGDGAVYNNAVVTDGIIDFGTGEVGATDISLGLGFVPTCTLLSPEWELQTGPTFGRVKFYHKVLVFTNDTMYLTLNGDTADARSTEDMMDEAPGVGATGVFQFTTTGNAVELPLTMTQEDPLSVSVTGVYGECSIGE